MYYFCKLHIEFFNNSMSENKKRIRFIVNPISGTQGKDYILSLIDEKIDKNKYLWELVYTERAGHAIEIAALAAEEGVDVVVAIGGDGTINEIGRSPVHSNTALAIILSASGNGPASPLPIHMDPKKALESIKEGCEELLELG